MTLRPRPHHLLLTCIGFRKESRTDNLLPHAVGLKQSDLSRQRMYDQVGQDAWAALLRTNIVIVLEWGRNVCLRR